MLQKIKSQIPNTITCLNLVAGAIACILAVKYYYLQLGALKGYEWAFVCIGAAAVFDFLDGAMARLLKAYSNLGKELDSLADEVSFGLAPSLLMFSTICYFNGGGFTGWALVALLIVVFGAVRLARFNIDDRQSNSFIGLPIPANAIFWIGFIGWIHAHSYPGNLFTAMVILITSSLMLSSMRMFSLKFKNFDWRENFRRYVILGAAVMFVLTEGLAGLAWTIVLYILISAVGRKQQD